MITIEDFLYFLEGVKPWTKFDMTDRQNGFLAAYGKTVLGLTNVLTYRRYIRGDGVNPIAGFGDEVRDVPKVFHEWMSDTCGETPVWQREDLIQILEGMK